MTTTFNVSRLLFVILILVVTQSASSESRVTRLVSRASPSDTANADSLGCGGNLVSADGRYVYFCSMATNLIAGIDERNEWSDIYLKDRQTGAVTLVSHANGNPLRTANDFSAATAITPDAEWLVFRSAATDLIAGMIDANETNEDTYLFQRSTGQIRLISRSTLASNRSGNGDSTPSAISADGSKILMRSDATDLVSGVTDANFADDIFLADRDSGTVTLLSYAAGTPGTAANKDTSFAVMTPDARFVALSSLATNLVAGVTDTNNREDTYLRDRSNGNTTLVSARHDNAQITADSISYARAISADGQKLVFASQATNLIPGFVNSLDRLNLYLLDRNSGTTRLISHAAGNSQQSGDNDTNFRGLSPDGRWVLFDSRATNLVSGVTDTNGSGTDVFLKDDQSDSLVLISHQFDNPLVTASGQSVSFALTADAQRVVFASDAHNLAAASTGNQFGQQAYAYHRASGTNQLLSSAASNPLHDANGESQPRGMDASGNVILVQTAASDMSNAADRNQKKDAYAIQLNPPAVTLLSRSVVATNTAAFASAAGALSGDGRIALFDSAAPNLDLSTPGLVRNTSAITYDRIENSLHLRSTALNSADSTFSESFGRRISPDGNWLLIQSDSPDFLPTINYPVFSWRNLFLVHRVSNTRTLVTRSAADPLTAANSQSVAIDMSPDGRCVLFESDASNLVAGATGTRYWFDVYLFDRVSNTVTLVSRSATTPGQYANQPSKGIAVSDDCNTVLFQSGATDLVSGVNDNNNRADIFVFRRQTGTNVLASHVFGNPLQPMNRATTGVALSPDGRRVLFYTDATNVSPNIIDRTPFGTDTYILDLDTGAINLVSRRFDQALETANDSSQPLAMSDDGTKVLYSSGATDLVAGADDSNDELDVFVFDANTGTSTLVSHAASSTLVTASGRSEPRGLSANGNTVLFDSRATNLVTTHSDADSYWDSFVFNVQTGNTQLVSRSRPPYVQTADQDVQSIALSADGNHVLFESYAENLGDNAADGNALKDVFLSSRLVEVSFQAGAGGSISPSNLIAIEPGQTISFSVMANPGMIVQSVSGCGSTWSGSGPHVSGQILSDCTISATFTMGPIADLGVSISNNLNSVGTGQRIEYTLVCSNAGPDAMSDIRVTLPSLVELSNVSWQCNAAASTAACPSPSVGSGTTLPSLTLAPATQATFRVFANVTGQAGGNAAIAASIEPPLSGNNSVPSNDTSMDTDSIYADLFLKDGFE